MVRLIIHNVPIDFPYEPYQCQLVYMEKVIISLENKCFALLESPTGTGKTLCLLCATLAWREYKKRQKIEQIDKVYRDILRIIYTSRTHAQLSQAVKEFKSTAYNSICISVRGSRNQLCIHEGIKNIKNPFLQRKKCTQLLSQSGCLYRNNIASKTKDYKNLCMDIEELAFMGKKDSVCPYYMSKELSDESEIIFMPYNYVVDANIRAQQSVDIDNSIIIFDEAHNIDKICEDACSVELPLSTFAGLLNSVKAAARYIKQHPAPADSHLMSISLVGSPHYIIFI
jgi:regulator of telomere elongation helicase 1